MKGTKSQVMAVEKALERVNNLEEKFDTFKGTVLKELSRLSSLLRLPYLLEPSVDAHIEGEYIHHIHFHRNHFSSHHETLKLYMYKFDGSNPGVWVAQMEQYFSLNEILEDQTKQAFIWTKRDQNGGSGIINVICYTVICHHLSPSPLSLSCTLEDSFRDL